MRRVSILLLALLILVALVGTPVAMAATGDVIVPVSGKIVDHPGQSFQGRVVDPNVSYDSTNDRLKVSGTLRGTLTRADGSTERVNQAFTTGAKAQTGSDTSGFSAAATACNILVLDIGRIQIDLLGLVIDLHPVHLDVTAVPGAGNLLGNLLCAVAGLLDPNAFLADFIEQLLRALFRV